MKKWGILLFLTLWSLNAAAQVANITSSGTTVDTGRQYQPQPVQNQIRQPVQQRQAAYPRQPGPAISETKQQPDENNLEEMENNPVLKTLRGSMRNSGDQKDARNIMILRAVVDYKMGDEKLTKEFETLENNREYNKKLEKIMQQLSNKKIRNTKNKEVMRILQDAGNRLYNLLAN